MKRSPVRILAVTAALVAGGALFGGLAGAIAITLVLALFGMLEWSILLLAARMGATLGAVLLPIAGWLLLRRVPLWRALTGTIVGTVSGSLVGLVVLSFFVFPLGMAAAPVLGAILGFLYAAIGLRRRFPAVPETAQIQVPRRVDY